MSWTRHVVLWFIVMFISLAILVLIAFIPSPPMVQSVIAENVEYLVETANTIDSIITSDSTENTSYLKRFCDLLAITITIYVNNARLNIFFSTPFIGGIIYGSSLVVNGWVGKHLAEILVGNEWYILLVYTLFASPHTYLEFLAYSIAVTESTILSIHIVKKRIEKKYLKYYMMYIMVSFTLLLIASLVEALMILLV